MAEVEYYGVTHVGRVRTNNEDNFYIDGHYKTNKNKPFDKYAGKSEKNKFLFSVCDGMGGTKLGEEASFEAVNMLSEQDGGNFSENLNSYIKKVNNKICEIAQKTGKSTGTTFVSLYIDDQFAEIANIGDSRCYMYRDGYIKQITRDHTEAQAMVEDGMLDANKAKSSAAFHILTQHLGIDENELVLEPDITRTRLHNDDIFLLCSDGLTDMLDDAEIAYVIRSGGDLKKIADMLVKKALEAGGHDNITLVIVKILNTKTNANITNSEKRKIIGNSFLLKFVIAIGLIMIVVISIWGINRSMSLNKPGEDPNFNDIETSAPSEWPTESPVPENGSSRIDSYIQNTPSVIPNRESY